MTTSFKALRWGVLATGWISNKVTLDLLIRPSTRGSNDVNNVITAVASRTRATAEAFVEKTWREAKENSGDEMVDSKPEDIKCMTYDEMYKSPDVDVIYIGTPHSNHYQIAHSALSHGKNVLCEKSLTVNAGQAKILFALAREKKLFLMEAVWTYFQPWSFKLQDIIASGQLGKLKGAQAELCIDMDPENRPLSDRMVDMEKAGGALLDLGPYPWVQLLLALLPPRDINSPSTIDDPPHPIPSLVCSMTKTKNTGVDLETQAIIKFVQPDGEILHGHFLASMHRRSPRAGIVEFEKGTIEIGWAAYRPESLKVIEFSSAASMQNDEKPISIQILDFSKRPGNCWGFVGELDEVYRCIRDGKLQSERMPWRDSILMMEVFDEMRKQGQFIYPESIETLDV